MTQQTQIDPTAQEIVERCRRIETRLTKYLESQGFETQVRRPFWNGQAVVVPAAHCAVSDMLSAIPVEHRGDDEIPVLHQGKILLYLYLPLH